ncbi:MAG: hypothetical protein E7019_04220 [Alphaproteobacteria bacterium]|nr:hypothetical protein [Alphaproteobacteria bacterium]
MSTTIGYSSELYLIDPQDLIKLKKTPVADAAIVMQKDPIIVLVGNSQSKQKDTLVCGRDIIKNAIANNLEYVEVRFVFHSNIANWNILPIFFKGLRKNYKFESKTIYHTSLSHLRSLHIERGFRNAENAYVISKRWHITPEKRIEKYNKLKNSILKKGFSDKFPISIMLCRRMGIKDSVDDGHHRIGLCVENNIDRIAIHFRAAGALMPLMQKFGLKIINKLCKIKH